MKYACGSSTSKSLVGARAPAQESWRAHSLALSVAAGPASLGVVALVVALALLLLAAPAGALAFTDVPANHPNALAINDLAARGIIGGYSDGTFGPGDPVIRQQFAKLIVLSMRLPRSEADVCPFSDVEPAGGTDAL